MEASLDYANGHFPQLMLCVLSGEEVVLRQGAVTVARIVPVSAAPCKPRPRVGETTSAPVQWTAESFAAWDEKEMKAHCLI